jgi:hypothetical protein|tara:strand:- start:259 stop:648 length:390 start_codon:yes stop_codon:yes gene_type:complete
MNTEYEIWTLMNLGLISNAMYMVAMVLLTWLGFRFAAAIAADPSTPMMGKITATVFYLIVGFMFYNTAQIGGMIIASSAENFALLPEMSSRAADLIVRVESGFIPGGVMTTALNIVIVFFQLAMTWIKR